MNDYYLKAADELALYEALTAAGISTNVIDTDGNVVGRQLAPGINLDVIGVIYQPTGIVELVDDEQVPQMAAIEGFHANLRGVLTDDQVAALPVIPTPNNPIRVWA